MIFISVAFPQRQFANILHVKYADGYKLFNCDVLIDILCLDWFVNVVFFPPNVIFDQKSYSTKRFSTKCRASYDSMTEYLLKYCMKINA